MKTTMRPILRLLTYLIKKSSKNYCFPSQDSILTILRTQYSCKISRRTLNRHLRKLEDDKYIKRIRRISRGPDNRPRFASTLYFIKKRVFCWLKRQAVFLRTIGFSISYSIVDQKKSAWEKAQAEKIQERPLSDEDNLASLRKLQDSLVG